jgi:DUF3037 family protein
VPERVSFDYAPIWVVPRVERDERLAAGVVLRCLARDFLDARIRLPAARLQALAPDLDAPLVSAHLAAILAVCAGGPAAGPVGALNQRERWHWLTAPRSAVIQIGPIHVGLCEDPALALDHLATGLCS